MPTKSSSLQNHQITKNVDSAFFAMKTNLSNPLYSIDSGSKKLHDLKEVLEKQLHEVSSITYPALTYDSYWIAALGLDKIILLLTIIMKFYRIS